MSQIQNGLSNDIKAFKKSWSSFWSALFGESKDFSKYAYMDNPSSIADEILFASWVLVLICTGFTLYYGIHYHLYIFKNSENQNLGSFLVSISLFLIAEILVVFFTHRLLRSLSNGFIKQGLANFALVIFMLGGIVYGFRWRYDISAKGYALINKQKATQEAISSTTDYKLLTADIDRQIEAANRSAAAGAKVTWKGKITEEGQRIIRESNKLADKLNATKLKMIEQAQGKDSLMLAEKTKQIELTAEQQGTYGGRAEILVIFGLISIAFCERINYKSNKKRAEESNEKQPSPTPKPKFFQVFQPVQTVTQPIQTVQSQPIGFKYGQQPETVITETPETPVNTPVITVITENQPQVGQKDAPVITETVRQLIQQLNTECRNYETGNGKRETIVKRLRTKYNTLIKTVEEHRAIVSPDIFINYSKATDRAYSIIVDYQKEGGQS